MPATLVMNTVNQKVRPHLESARIASMLSSPHVWWRHPVARIAITWVILVEDYFIYAEDPVNDSHVIANFPGMGHMMGLITLHTSETAGLGFLRFFLVIVSLFVGFWLGRQFLVRIVRRRWKLMAFDGFEGAFSVVSMFMCAAMMGAALLYNLMIPSWAAPLTGASMELLVAFGAKSLEYRHINQSFQTLSGSVDLLAIAMVTDQVYQDYLWYPNWAPCTKLLWNSWRGRTRVICFWVFMIVGVALTAHFVFKTGTDPGDIYWDNTRIGGMTEIARSLLASCIVFTDLFTVLQDWAFPMFIETLEVEVPVKIAGTYAETFRCNCLGVLWRKLPTVTPACVSDFIRKYTPDPDFFALSLNGKWLTYGPLLGVMLIDLFCARSQMTYDPESYGQYVDPVDERIYVITDDVYLAEAYDKVGTLLQPVWITYGARWNTTTGLPISDSTLTDIKLNSRFVGSSVKYLGLVLALIYIAIFGVLLKLASVKLHRGLTKDRLETPAEEAPAEMEPEEGSPPAPGTGVPPDVRWGPSDRASNGAGTGVGAVAGGALCPWLPWRTVPRF